MVEQARARRDCGLNIMPIITGRIFGIWMEIKFVYVVATRLSSCREGKTKARFPRLLFYSF